MYTLNLTDLTSLQLLEYVAEEGLNTCGTVRSNRTYLPLNLSGDESLNRGNSDVFVSNRRLCYVRYKDNSVKVLSEHRRTEQISCLIVLW